MLTLLLRWDNVAAQAPTNMGQFIAHLSLLQSQLGDMVRQHEELGDVYTTETALRKALYNLRFAAVSIKLQRRSVTRTTGTVMTTFGRGTVVARRGDGFTTVALPFGTAIVTDAAIFGTDAHAAAVQQRVSDMRRRAVAAETAAEAMKKQVRHSRAAVWRE
jgi:hypothetical protein